jgi:hypothetical protein
VRFNAAPRTTSFNPDQTSVTAHTLMSMNPDGSAIARIVFSVTSVGIPADFFGQDAQMMARAFSAPLK